MRMITLYTSIFALACAATQGGDRDGSSDGSGAGSGGDAGTGGDDSGGASEDPPRTLSSGLHTLEAGGESREFIGASSTGCAAPRARLGPTSRATTGRREDAGPGVEPCARHGEGAVSGSGDRLSVPRRAGRRG